MVMIRFAAPSDVPEIAAIHVRAWQAAYRGHMPDSFLDALDRAQRASWWSRVVVEPSVTVLVALDHTTITGFYEALGFSADGHSKTDSRLGLPLREVRYRWRIPPSLRLDP
jgi:hypothetical protein